MLALFQQVDGNIETGSSINNLTRKRPMSLVKTNGSNKKNCQKE